MRIEKWLSNKGFTALLALVTLLLAGCGDSTLVASSATTSTTTNTTATTTASGAVAALPTSAFSPTPATTVALPGNGTPTPIIGAKGGATMKEAFAVVDQQVKS